jgi:ribosome-associated translation inhibitor RaiA
MQIQVNTDNHIQGGEELTRQVTATIESALARFAKHLTRVEVHLSDENSHKRKDGDKRCAIEARPAGRQPVAVTHHANNLDDAVDGAAEQVKRLLESLYGKLMDHKGRTSFAGEQGY